MTPDQLEFSISQYIDGALAPLEQAVLDEVLATDANARALLEQYRKLNALVKRRARRAGESSGTGWRISSANQSRASVRRLREPTRCRGCAHSSASLWRRRCCSCSDSP
jgi:anti-sigma factor RsiW